MRFKTIEELENFKDTAMFCLCGGLMTGLHMNGCRKLRKEEEKLKQSKGSNFEREEKC